MEPEYIIGLATELRIKGAGHTEEARWAFGTGAIAAKLEQAAKCYNSAARWEAVAQRLISMRLVDAEPAGDTLLWQPW